MKRLLLAAALLAPTSSLAFSSFQAEVPNGRANRCQTCHDRPGGGSPWNAFGDLLFTENGGTAENDDSINASDPSFIWWNAAICGADSDGDGQTNGQELGDPNCEWVSGDAARTADISNPGLDTSTSADPDGVGGGEGEGEGEGEAPGCGGSAAVLLPTLVLLRRRRR